MTPKVTPELESALEWLAGRMRACQWCGTVFVARTPRHAYCKPSHQVMASRARTKARERKGR